MDELRLDVNFVDYAILAIYFVAVLGIGFAAKRFIKTSLDYFLSGRSLPAWITGLAFISANLGALEILGMAANGAQFGLYTLHYYWIGAIPAMVFLGLVMMPFYYGSQVRSVPEYLRLRFNKPTHVFNAMTFAIATVLIAGVDLYALALVLKLLLPVADPARHRRRRRDRAGLHHARRPRLGDLQRGAAVLHHPGRADPAHDRRPCRPRASGRRRRTPLIGAYPKIFIPAVTIIPGLLALVLIPDLGSDKLNMEYNNAIPLLINEFLPNGMLGLALVGLIAAFMAGVAANVSAFNTVVTYDLWEPYVRQGRDDDYYLRFGRIATVGGILIGILTALIASGYTNIMDYIQLLFSFFNAPLFATFIIGMFWRRMTPWAGFWGLVAGTAPPGPTTRTRAA